MSFTERREQAKAQFDEANRLYESGDRAGAMQTLRDAIAQAPDLPWLHDELGHALTWRHDYWHNPTQQQQLIDSGELDEAIVCWNKALELGIVSHWTLFNLGHAHTAKGEYDKAAEFLGRSIDLKTADHYPEHAKAYGDSGTRKGPDFILIGATKCGTTSLYEYMRHHPQVLPAVWKEIEYFRFPERGLDWYLSHFPKIPDSDTRFVTGEASTCYMSIWDAKTQVREAFPDAKLIALVRDSVDKTISHAHHDRKIGVESRTMEQAITDELDILEKLDRPWHEAEEYWKTQRGYVWLSMYVYFLENWLTEIPKEQLLVIPSEDLYGKPAETLTKVYEHLGLPDHQLDEYPVFLKGSYERKNDPIRQRLLEFFEPHTARLEELLGRRLDWQRA